MTLFTVVYRPGPKWVQGRRFHEQEGIVAHREFLGDQFNKRTLVAAGPFLDDRGGIAIFECESPSELDALLQSDNTIAGGLMTYETHPCALPFLRGDPSQ